MNPQELHEVSLYRSARIDGKTRDEARQSWQAFPFEGGDDGFRIGGFDGLTLAQALAKVETQIQSSPYYDSRQDRIVAPQLTRTYS